jgi:hypothetical protein
MEPENWPAVSVLFGVNTVPFIISCNATTANVTLKWVGVNTDDGSKTGYKLVVGTNSASDLTETLVTGTKLIYTASHTQTCTAGTYNVKGGLKDVEGFWSQPKKITVAATKE